jgi:hypothetical protein
MTVRYIMPLIIGKYYKTWVNTYPLFAERGAPKFYRFVKACLRYGNKRRSGTWLRHFLEKDLPGKYRGQEYIEEKIQEAVSLFDHLIDYHYTCFPDAILENRNPVAVRAKLGSFRKEDGKPFYSDEELESILARKFAEKCNGWG